MDALSVKIQECNLNLILDNKTEGFGDCFPYAIVQQCRRPNIKKWLKENNPDGFFSSHLALRRKVKIFALNSPHKTINDFKQNCSTVLANGKEMAWIKWVRQEPGWIPSSFR